MQLGAALFGVVLAASAGPEVLDRIAATVGSHVVTESDVIEEIRVTAFIEGTEPNFGPEQKRKTVERLIDQELMRREVLFTRFPLPTQSDIAPLYKQIRERFPSDAAYQAELKRYALTDSDIRRHVQWQLMTLRFIEYRFQPGVQISEGDIRREYEDFARRSREAGTEVPPLEKVHDEMDKIVRQRLVDSALDRWLGEVRTQNSILYRKGYEQ